MAYIFIILLVIAAFGMVVFKEARFLFRVRSCTELKKGTVTKLTEKVFLNGSSHRSTFIPTVEFEADGTMYSGDAEHSYYYNAYEIGGEVWIYHDPQNPWRMILADERKQSVATIVTAVLLFAVSIGYLVILAAKYGK